MNTNDQNTNVLSESDMEMAQAGIIELPAQGDHKNKPPKEENDGDENGGDEGDDNKEGTIVDDKKKPEGQKVDTKAPVDNPPADDEEELSEEKLLAQLAKKGVKVGSLKDLNKPAPTKELTDEEKAEAAEKKKTDAIAFGFEKKLFSKKDYDAFQAFTNTDKALVVKENFIADLKKENPELSDVDAEDTFNTFFHTYEDDDSVKFKLGQQEIAARYEKLKGEKFPQIARIEDLYDGVQKNLQNATLYKGLVDAAFSKLPTTRTIKVDNTDLNITLYTPDQLEKAKGDYLTAEMMESALTEDGTIDETALLDMVEKDLFYENRFSIIEEAAKSLADLRVRDNKIGRKAANFNEDQHDSGGAHNTNPDAKSDSDRELEEAQDKGII